jgi:hypothetical protein
MSASEALRYVVGIALIAFASGYIVGTLVSKSAYEKNLSVVAAICEQRDSK